MARKKIKLAYILNDKARKSCLNKRRVGLIKKVSELTVLCGVDAFCIVYSPEENDQMVFPLPPRIQQLIAQYQNLPHIERDMKSMNQESYLIERVRKAEDVFRREEQKMKDMDLSRYMHQVHFGRSDEFTIDELNYFVWLLHEKLMDIGRRIEYHQTIPLPVPQDFTLGFPNQGENFNESLDTNYIIGANDVIGQQFPPDPLVGNPYYGPSSELMGPFHQVPPSDDMGGNVDGRQR